MMHSRTNEWEWTDHAGDRWDSGLDFTISHISVIYFYRTTV